MEEEIVSINIDGFYKYDGGNLLYSMNSVYNPNYILLREDHNSYTFPIDGWYWFNSEEDAKLFFKIP